MSHATAARCRHFEPGRAADCRHRITPFIFLSSAELLFAISSRDYEPITPLRLLRFRRRGFQLPRLAAASIRYRHFDNIAAFAFIIYDYFRRYGFRYIFTY